MSESRKDRKWLRHDVPASVPEKSPVFFVTICAATRNKNTLTLPDTGPAILEAVQHRYSVGEWSPRILLLMPDHLHGLVSFPRTVEIKQTIKSFKSWIARTTDVRWQQGVFDHRLRSDENLDETFEYIRQNPVRAGLVASLELWPWVWRPPGT